MASKALLKDDGSIYNINKKQAAKKPKLFGIVGESLSYFASLIRNDYGDITVGVIDKLAIVAFICSKTAMPMADRLNLIPALIKTVSEKTVDAPVDGVVNTLKQDNFLPQTQPHIKDIFCLCLLCTEFL